ncbi:MAG: Dabb family protein [Sphingomonas sp.]|nr:Dabb family protein [Sphingomonas sp.]
MAKFTALITLQPGADREAFARGIGDATLVQSTLPGVFDGGDLILHRHAGEDAVPSDPAIAHIDSAAYEPIGGGALEPALRNGVYRCLLLAVKPGTPEATVRQFESETLAMPHYIGAIRNWRLSRVTKASGARAWTHVWEQEYADIGGLLGPYMTNPYHWARVDRWFDPECPEWIVDTRLCHSFCAFERSVLQS